jgi:cytidine deaminase
MNDQAELIDWGELRRVAVLAADRAYVPYSRYPVGASALVDDGRLIAGCNVENASLGLTLCAECSLVSALVGSGGGRLIAVACVDQDGQMIYPCGRCRQLLYEHGGPTLLIGTARGAIPLSALLPQPWGADNLTRRDGPGTDL